MKKTMLALTFAAFTTLPAAADTKAFRDIIGNAANIQVDAEALGDRLKSKVTDESAIKAEVAALAQDIEALRKDIENLDGRLQDLTPEQRKNWELAKTKAQLLQILSDAKKMRLESGDINKDRGLLRSQVKGIADRAALLQRTVNSLDR
jgi:hypothetical protein